MRKPGRFRFVSWSPTSAGLLKPDMFATAEFTPRRRRPSSRTRIGRSGSERETVVFVRTQPACSRRREVTSRVLASIARFRSLAGLEAGTPVVVNGAYAAQEPVLKSADE